MAHGTVIEAPKRQRDLRLDFFRGIAMLIIFIAHVPGNLWTRYIPARFGPSDATEMFVFCSGFASAIAFGGVFLRSGFAVGVLRVLFRCWQIYWAHIALFVTVATVCVVGTSLLDTRDYVGQLNLHPFFEDPRSGLVHLLTFTYVPNYFDILPMYFVCLLMLPMVVALQRIHSHAAAGLILSLWVANRFLDFGLPAEWWSDRVWFFNPFGWQLIFFTGFMLGSGWIKPPKPNRWLIAAAATLVLVLLPISFWDIRDDFDILQDLRRALGWGYQKTDFGILRYLHFLALAYLAHCLFHDREEILEQRWAAPLVTVGQQALATFLFSMTFARIAGMTLDVIGRTKPTFLLVNVTGLLIAIAVAYGVSYIKSQPWRKPRGKAPRPSPPPAAAPLPPPGGPRLGDRQAAAAE